jgi:hypothetical protein
MSTRKVRGTGWAGLVTATAEKRRIKKKERDVFIFARLR